jgi:hypothetical protein
MVNYYNRYIIIIIEIISDEYIKIWKLLYMMLDGAVNLYILIFETLVCGGVTVCLEKKMVPSIWSA